MFPGARGSIPTFPVICCVHLPLMMNIFLNLLCIGNWCKLETKVSHEREYFEQRFYL